MSAYNMFLHNGLSQDTALLWIKTLLPTFLLSFTISYFIVSPNVKKLSFKLAKNKPQHIDKFMTIFMIISMVLIMSIYGTVMSNGINVQFFSNYLINIVCSFVVALPLQLIFIKPLVKKIFNKILELRTLVRTQAQA